MPDSRARFRIEQRRLALVTGAVTAALPIFLAVLGSILDQFGLGKFTKSLSQFYYQGVLLGNIFVGCLFLLGTLLLAYRGSSQQVGRLASVMGVSIFVIALFPSAGWIGPTPDVRLFREETHLIHAIASATLFALLAYFSLVVFTRVSPHQRYSDGRVLESKRMRNKVYRTCGIIILLAVCMIGVAQLLPKEFVTSIRVTFWAEAFMLAAAGISWIVQGRAVPRAMLDERDIQDRETSAQPYST